MLREHQCVRTNGGTELFWFLCGVYDYIRKIKINQIANKQIITCDPDKGEKGPDLKAQSGD